MTTNRLVQTVALAISLICLLVVSFVIVPNLEAQRAKLQLGFARTAAESVKPSVAFASTMLGPARVFAINGLWYEVEQLKQEGKFAQINEMSRWITMLQPRFPEVWRFMAWNMAYNVSVQCYTQEERWDWVHKGIRLLREEGLRYNPRAVRLYRELSWIFYHKMGQYSDDVQWYYKTRLAREWQELLGAYSQGWDKAKVAAWFKLILDAPDDLTNKAGTGLLQVNPQVAPILTALLKAEKPYDLEPSTADARKAARERMLREFGKVLLFNFTARLEELPFWFRDQPQFFDTDIAKLLKQEELREPIAALLAHLRKRVLIDNYNMQPTDIVELVERYGPVDFRHPAAHGMYWGHLGVRIMDDRKNQDKIDRINTLRQRIHTMQDFTDTGRIFYDPYADLPGSDRPPIVLGPDVRFVEAYEKAVKDAEAELTIAERGDDKPYKTGHENFLLKATLYYMYAGNMEMSAHYYNKAKELFGKEPHNLASKRYENTYEENLIIEMKNTMENLEDAAGFVILKVSDAFNSLALGYTEEFETKLRWARITYDTYQKSTGETAVSPKQGRMKLPQFDQMVTSALMNGMVNQATPLPLEFRMKMWRAVPLWLRQAVYDRIKSRLDQEAKDAGLTPEVAFPEPDNMAAYRLRNPLPTQPRPENTNPLSPLKP